MNLTFLNGVFLAAIAAAAIPIIIHLLQRRRLKRIEFSDLRFLAPLNQQRMRSMNLRRLLLLVLRVLIVAFTALAMARPSVRGSLTSLVPTQARSSVLLLMDTSYSMRTEGEHGTALDEAKAAAFRLLQELQQGDEVNLMTFDEAPRRWFQTPVHDFDVVRRRLEELQSSHRSTHWAEAVEAALDELTDTLEPNRELYIISDFVGTDPESVRADLQGKQGDIRVTLVPARVERFVNVSVEGVRVPPGAILRDDPLRVGVSVRNHAADVPADCVLRVELDGEPKGEASLRLGRGALQTHDFTLVATQAREIAGTASKRVDRLPVDDVYHFVLPVLARLHVLHIAGASAAGGSFFVSRALEPSREGRSPIHLAEVQAPRFSSSDLAGMQVVVLSSDAPLTESQSQILAKFVEGGGGLCMLSGQRETADLANRLLARLGDARVRGVVPRQEGFLNLADLRPTGILTGFEDEELQALERVQFTRYAELTPGVDSRTVLRFAGGEPALVEGTPGTGKFMLYAFDAGTDGSDLALSPMFLPLMHRTIVYLTGETGRQKLDYEVGERIEVHVPISGAERRTSLLPAGGPRYGAGGAGDDRYARAGTSDGGAVPRKSAAAGPGSAGPDDARTFTVTTPSGHQEAVVARYVGKIAIVAYENTGEPGHYVFEGLGHRLVRAVNVDTRESDLREFGPRDLVEAMGLEADELPNAASIGQHISEARHGKELYKLIIALVLLLMIVELLLSRVASSAPPSAGPA
ncbi:MAG: BatA domain-containing protein [Candidatus Krumholzibacteriia bacterium]